MTADDITSLRLRIEGFVQAVGFRQYCTEEAGKLALDGSIRNRSDGTVEVLISGPTPAVETFVALAMRGPAGSKIKNVELHNSEPPAEKGFHRRPSV